LKRITVKRIALISAAIAALASSALAQYPVSPPVETLKGTPVTPRRLPDGKPNWTGFWIPAGGLLDVYRGPSGVTGLNLGDANVPRKREDIPAMKSPYKEQYEALFAPGAKALPDPAALCFPVGMPRIMMMTYGMEILQTPKIVSMTSEWQAGFRRIWMDVKAHPPADELDETYNGHSIGRWVGDTLVVETVGLRQDITLDTSRIPHGPRTKIVERFSEVSPGVLVDDITIEDPDVFVTPWTYRYVYLHKPDLRLREYVCLENNRNIDEAGSADFGPPQATAK
jgi:hypothetical protein